MQSRLVWRNKMPGAVAQLVERLSRMPEAQVSILNATKIAHSGSCLSFQDSRDGRIKSSRCGKPGLSEILAQKNKTGNKNKTKQKPLTSEYMQWKMFESFTGILSVRVGGLSLFLPLFNNLYRGLQDTRLIELTLWGRLSGSVYSLWWSRDSSWHLLHHRPHQESSLRAWWQSLTLTDHMASIMGRCGIPREKNQYSQETLRDTGTTLPPGRYRRHLSFMGSFPRDRQKQCDHPVFCWKMSFLLPLPPGVTCSRLHVIRGSNPTEPPRIY